MIFATVGTQGPFDRLVQALDSWAKRNEIIPVFAQIGGGARPRHIDWVDFLDPVEFRLHVQRASLVLSHAGMGTLLSALEIEKPIVVMPRKAELGEQRNDHQLATARRFCLSRGIRVVHEVFELEQVLDDLHGIIPAPRIRSEASQELLRTIREFVDATGAAPGRPRS